MGMAGSSSTDFIRRRISVRRKSRVSKRDPAFYLLLTMHQQSLDQAITTGDLLCKLQGGCGEPKHGLRDFLFSASEVGTVLSVCWMMHCFI